MLSSYKEKEIARVSNLIDSYNEDMLALETELNGINEKYRKIIEEESKEIQDSLSYYREVKNGLMAQLVQLTGEAKEDAQPTKRRKGAKKEEEIVSAEPEKVVDTIYPENNEEPAEDLVLESPQPEDDLPFGDAEESVPVTEEEVFETEESENAHDGWSESQDGPMIPEEDSDDTDIWNEPVKEW